MKHYMLTKKCYAPNSISVMQSSALHLEPLHRHSLTEARYGVPPVHEASFLPHESQESPPVE